MRVLVRPTTAIGMRIKACKASKQTLAKGTSNGKVANGPYKRAICGKRTEGPSKERTAETGEKARNATWNTITKGTHMHATLG